VASETTTANPNYSRPAARCESGWPPVPRLRSPWLTSTQAPVSRRTPLLEDEGDEQVDAVGNNRPVLHIH
jgi:hypothetical protein